MRYFLMRLKRGIVCSIRDLYYRNEGFALFEGVLIIFIVGFVITSVIVGQALMEHAKAQSLVQEIQDLRERIRNFETVYDYKPGDFPNSSDFWGVSSCGGHVYGANGDGDGLISYRKLDVHPNKHDATIESFAAWCHMAMASMGPHVSVLTDFDSEPVMGVNLPRTKIGGAFHLTSGAGEVFGLDDNIIVVGVPTKDMSRPRAILTPKQAMKIDKLMKDTGSPLTGKVRAASGLDAMGVNECVVGGEYNLAHRNEKLCIMAFVIDDQDIKDSGSGDDDFLGGSDDD